MKKNTKIEFFQNEKTEELQQISVSFKDCSFYLILNTDNYYFKTVLNTYVENVLYKVTLVYGKKIQCDSHYAMLFNDFFRKTDKIDINDFIYNLTQVKDYFNHQFLEDAISELKSLLIRRD